MLSVNSGTICDKPRVFPNHQSWISPKHQESRWIKNHSQSCNSKVHEFNTRVQSEQSSLLTGLSVFPATSSFAQRPHGCFSSRGWENAKMARRFLISLFGVHFSCVSPRFRCLLDDCWLLPFVVVGEDVVLGGCARSSMCMSDCDCKKGNERRDEEDKKLWSYRSCISSAFLTACCASTRCLLYSTILILKKASQEKNHWSSSVASK